MQPCTVGDDRRVRKLTRFSFKVDDLCPAFTIIGREGERNRVTLSPVTLDRVVGEANSAVVQAHEVDTAVVIGQICRVGGTPSAAVIG